MKRTYLIALLLACMAGVYAQTGVNVTKSEGWLETAMLQWTSVSGATKYSVSYSGENISGKADDMLIRSYSDYVRCDIPGLKAGTYSLVVKAYDDKGGRNRYISCTERNSKGAKP